MPLLPKIKNRLKLPVIAAPMFLVSSPQLVINACKSGIIGAFPMTNARKITDLHSWMDKIAASLTENGAPYAVNIIVHSTYKRFQEELEIIREYQPEIVITSLGDPSRVTDIVHAYGGQVWSDVNNMKYARIASTKGVDGLILVGAGAGGHTGDISPFVFIDAVKKFWNGTIILAGAIASARAIKAAEILGADLCYMGTRFIGAEESFAPDAYKDLLVDGEIDDLVLTDTLTGLPAFFIKQSLENAGFDVSQTANKGFNTEFLSSADSDSKAWKDIWSSGQGITNIHDSVPVEKIVTRLYKEYQKL